MLVLTRKRGESIVITVDDTVITIHLLETDRGKVRIGIEAPPSVNILRSELLDKESPNSSPDSPADTR